MSITVIAAPAGLSTAASRTPHSVGLAKSPMKSPAELEWIAALAEPYLRSYTPVAECTESLAGYRFLVPSAAAIAKRQSKPRPSCGFFVGYLHSAADFSFLRPAPPECLVFWFVKPVGGALHRRLVTQPQSLARHTTEYIRWLTHRPPRFELYDREPITLVRHDSMQAWPREKHEHLSRNFFIETLAWLVRSGLVRHLPVAMVQNDTSL